MKTYTFLLSLCLLIPTTSANAQWSIAVFPFENEAKDAEWAWFANGIPLEIEGRFYQTPRLLAFGKDRLHKTLGNTWRQIVDNPALAERVQTRIVLRGTYRVADHQIQIEVEAIDTRKSTLIGTFKGQSPLQSPTEALHPILLALTETLRVDLSPDQKTALQTPTTASLSAFRAHTEAVLALRLALAQDPPREDLLTQAERGFQTALQHDPAYADPRFRLGKLYEARKKPAEAERAYREALKHNLDHVAARYHLGLLFKNQNRPSEALAELESALRQSPIDTEIQTAMSSIFFSQYNQTFERVSTQLQDAIKASPNDPAVYYELGNAYNELGRYTEAAEAYQKAIQRDSTFADAHFKLGLILYGKSQYQGAIDALKTAIQNRTSFRRIHFRLGDIFISQERYDDAAEQFQTALRVEPNYILSYYKFGFCLQALGQEEEALKTYQRYAELSTDDSRPYFQTGEIYLRRDMKKDALTAFQNALSLNSVHVPTRLRLAYLYADLKTFDKAILELQTALRLQPDHPDAESLRKDIQKWQ
ncbi:MAG: tetratricopeptide repeat protein [bacterium]|nr:tetratricopeptide repeat protein [bacterium]